VLQATRDPVSDTEVPSETMKPPSEARCVVDRDIGKGAVAARRHGRVPEGGGGLFAIEGSPESPKPADGEPSETEPVPLADPQGTQSTRAMSSSSRLQRDFVIR
jgi:hypothetical protein